jgi:DNA-directed RNA polymerase subunit RPC12/RpoP
MAIKCGNCGGHFTDAEILQRQRPRYPWNLTPGGQRALVENQLRQSTQPPCPECGQRTLLG